MRHSWLPNKLDDVLRMAKIWLDVLATEKAAAWGVPPAERTELEPLVNTAELKLAAAKSNERTQVITAECREDRYYKAPSLSDPGFTLLELNIPDTVHTRRGTPKAQMTAEIGQSGTAMLMLKLIYAEGTEALADMHTDIEYQVRHGKFNPARPVSNAAAGEIIAVPVNPLELPMVFTTGRRHENISYSNEDSGKTAYFDIRISNGTYPSFSPPGPWCPIFSAVIP